MSISLSKEQSKVRLEKRTKEVSEIVKINLTKHNLSPDTKARVAFVIDISGSMMHAWLQIHHIRYYYRLQQCR